MERGVIPEHKRQSAEQPAMLDLVCNTLNALYCSSFGGMQHIDMVFLSKPPSRSEIL